MVCLKLLPDLKNTLLYRNEFWIDMYGSLNLLDVLKTKGNRTIAELRYGEKDIISHTHFGSHKELTCYMYSP